jgi:uncharacterized protein (TIGR02611 family)
MATEQKPAFVERMRAQRDRHKERSKIIRGLAIVAGFTVLLSGLAMLVLPGPALAVIPLGLAILALEFTWAEQLLERSLEQAAKAKDAAANTSTAQRALTAAAVVLGVAAFVVWAAIGDVPVLPV